jgi:hypothetical protein
MDEASKRILLSVILRSGLCLNRIWFLFGRLPKIQQEISPSHEYKEPIPYLKSVINY